jgi:hypothetical protein
LHYLRRLLGGKKLYRVQIVKNIIKLRSQFSPGLVWEQPNHRLDLPSPHQTHLVRGGVPTKEQFTIFIQLQKLKWAYEKRHKETVHMTSVAAPEPKPEPEPEPV